MDELLDYEDNEQKNHGSMRNFIENQSGFWEYRYYYFIIYMHMWRFNCFT